MGLIIAKYESYWKGYLKIDIHIQYETSDDSQCLGLPKCFAQSSVTMKNGEVWYDNYRDMQKETGGWGSSVRGTNSFGRSEASKIASFEQKGMDMQKIGKREG